MPNANFNSTAPGERLIRTMTNVEFGHGRPPDEPAPERVIQLYQRFVEALDDERISFRSQLFFRSQLSRAMRYHRSSCYTVNGVRLQWYTEPHGTRREYLKITEIEP